MILVTTRQISLYGLGVRVGEADHPEPPKSLLRRHLVDHTSKKMAARISVSPSPRATLFDVDVPSSVPPTVPASSGEVAHVEVAQDDNGRMKVADVVAEVQEGEFESIVMFQVSGSRCCLSVTLRVTMSRWSV